MIHKETYKDVIFCFVYIYKYIYTALTSRLTRAARPWRFIYTYIHLYNFRYIFIYIYIYTNITSVYILSSEAASTLERQYITSVIYIEKRPCVQFLRYIYIYVSIYIYRPMSELCSNRRMSIRSNKSPLFPSPLTLFTLPLYNIRLVRALLRWSTLHTPFDQIKVHCFQVLLFFSLFLNSFIHTHTHTHVLSTLNLYYVIYDWPWS
jgi:hypothetical protein